MGKIQFMLKGKLWPVNNKHESKTYAFPYIVYCSISSCFLFFALFQQQAGRLEVWKYAQDDCVLNSSCFNSLPSMNFSFGDCFNFYFMFVKSIAQKEKVSVFRNEKKMQNAVEQVFFFVGLGFGRKNSHVRRCHISLGTKYDLLPNSSLGDCATRRAPW